MEWEENLHYTHACVQNNCLCKFNAKIIKCLFLGYCEDTKAYWFICLETNKIIKNKDIVFTEVSGIISDNLEMRPSGRNKGPTVVVVDQSSKSPFFDGGGQSWMTISMWEVMELQLKRHMKANNEGPVNDDISVDESGDYRRCSMRE